MKVNRKLTIAIISVFLLISFIVFFCLRDNTKKDIEDALGVEIDFNISNVHYSTASFSPDWINPYNTYISFETSLNDYNTFVKEKLGLVKYSRSPETDSLLCLYKFDPFFYNYFWSFKGTNYSRDHQFFKKYEESISWWSPIDTIRENLYANYYNFENKKHVVNCTCEHWTGKILSQYLNGKVFILIEVY